MIIKNYEVEKFGKFLFELSLKGRKSLMRTRFIKLLQARLDLLEEERQQLISDFAKRDDKGEFIYEDFEDGRKGIIIAESKEFNLEIIKMMDEDFILEETPDKVEMFTEVRDIVLNCDIELSGDAAMEYDRWCEIVEDFGIN